MRKLLFVLALLSFCWGCSPRQAMLKGHIVNYHGEVVRICTDGNAYQRDTLKVDSLGNFVFLPAERQGGIYEISVKDHMPWISVYLGEGDRSEVRLTLTADKKVESSFSGDRVTENEYLKAYDGVENSRAWYAPEMEGLSFEAYRALVEEKEQHLQELLDKVEDVDVKAQLAARQHLMFQRQLVYYSWRCRSGQAAGETAPDEDFAAYIGSIDVNSPKECDDDILGVIVGQKLDEQGFTGEGDYMVAYLDVLDRLVTNPEVKNRHATGQLMRQFQYFSGNSFGAAVERYNALCTDDSLKVRVNAEYAEYERVYGNLMPGKPAPDFEMADVNGRKCRLSDLKGKFLFIDFWATWCAPCRDEIPYMAKLQEHFAGDARIALVSISVDANVKTLKDFLAKEKPAWAQYVVDAENNGILDKEYRIFGIPHFMLLDPEGRFVSYAFTRPSDPRCAELIEQAMNQ